MQLAVGDVFDQEDLIEKFHNLSFNNSDIVVEPGDFSIRGCIIDVFSYGHEDPYRIVFDNNTIEEITYF